MALLSFPLLTPSTHSLLLHPSLMAPFNLQYVTYPPFPSSLTTFHFSSHSSSPSLLLPPLSLPSPVPPLSLSGSQRSNVTRAVSSLWSMTQVMPQRLSSLWEK